MEANKKRAAVASAVIAYIQTEEEALCLQQLQGGEAQKAPAPTAAPAAAFKPWGFSGRQEQMQLRGLMQLKAFQGWKMR
ncbi:MAG: hypothetical protein WCD46_08715 [Desulfobacterales bacterium]|jgi:hypothetical protein